MRIRFGSTLWNNGMPQGGKIFIKVPKGYICDVPEPEKDGKAHARAMMPVTMPREANAPLENDFAFLSVDMPLQPAQRCA